MMETEELRDGVYLVKIKKSIAYMDPDMYTQAASYNATTKRFYVNRGAAGGISISVKSVEVIRRVGM